jgi:NhaC family Na+:H+ antiporter
MDLLFTLLFAFGLLLVSVFRGVSIAYPLLCTLVLLSGVLLRRGFPLSTLLKFGWQGSCKATPVFSILLLIGAVTSTWMAAGTVPAIVYYGIQWIHPQTFILAAFLLTSLVSWLIGTSFGAAGTIGLALMIMAKGSQVNPHLLAGAVIAGAYWGDRCSPMSSSAHLIAAMTHTKLYSNIKHMLYSGWLPLGISVLLYWGYSWLTPVQTEDWLSTELDRCFHLEAWALLPAGLILGLALLRVPAFRSMLLSIGMAIGLAVFGQGYSLGQVIQFAIWGFELEIDTPIQSILLGGGMLSMARVCGIVLISTTIAGILSGTQSLQIIERWLRPLRSRGHIFLGTMLVSGATSAFGCSQTIAILLTDQLMRDRYEDQLTAADLAIDLENTAVVIAPLIPWNIAGLVPATVLMTDWRFIPYAFYLYLVPVCVLLQLWQLPFRRSSSSPKS